LVLQAISRVVVMIALVASCGKKSESPVTKQDAGSGKTVAAPIALPALGVDKPMRFNFQYNEGGNAYDKAIISSRRSPATIGSTASATRAIPSSTRFARRRTAKRSASSRSRSMTNT
jgi:hypothetical protein